MTVEDDDGGLKPADTVSSGCHRVASILFPLPIPAYNFDARRTIAARGINYSFSFLAAVPPTKTVSAPPRLATGTVDNNKVDHKQQDCSIIDDTVTQPLPDVDITNQPQIQASVKIQDLSCKQIIPSCHQLDHDQSPGPSPQGNKEPNKIHTAPPTPIVNPSTSYAAPSSTRSASRLPVRKSVSSPSKVNSPQTKGPSSNTNNNNPPPPVPPLTRSTSEGEHSNPKKTTAAAASKKPKSVDNGTRVVKNGSKSNGTLKKASKAAAGEANVSMPGTNTNQSNDDEEIDVKPMRLTPSERRRREAKRAEQIKFWRAREEREARDARLLARRKLMAEGQEAARRRRMQEKGQTIEEPTSPRQDSPPSRKAVKFNLRLNRVIEIKSSERNVEQQQR